MVVVEGGVTILAHVRCDLLQVIRESETNSTGDKPRESRAHLGSFARASVPAPPRNVEALASDRFASHLESTVNQVYCVGSLRNMFVRGSIKDRDTSPVHRDWVAIWRVFDDGSKGLLGPTGMPDKRIRLFVAGIGGSEMPLPDWAKIDVTALG